jgi:hypothetical protein
MTNKYRRLFHRSEYQQALDNYRKARRRGDAADAQRWIRIADMHLRVADRFDEGVHAALVRETELTEARTREQAEQNRLSTVRPQRSLDELIKQFEESEAMHPDDV